MAETIYTIPVNEAFESDCECPICELRRRFEQETVDYYAGPSLMEPDTRIITNDVGFCGRHFDMLYHSQAKKLGLGLMLDTYMSEQIKRLKKYAQNVSLPEPDENTEIPVKKGLFGKKKVAAGNYQGLANYIKKHNLECAVCGKLNYTMDRYLDIVFHMYNGDREFREKFRNSKGFCLPHLAILIELAEKKLTGSRKEEFLSTAIGLEIRNLERIEGEVDWFTKKFDYRNVDADWGNSRDALPRGIQKMSGTTDVYIDTKK